MKSGVIAIDANRVVEMLNPRRKKCSACRLRRHGPQRRRVADAYAEMLLRALPGAPCRLRRAL